METNRSYNILHIINVRRRGGSGEAAARLCEALHARGHRVTVICPPEFEWSGSMDRAGLRVINDFPIKFDLRPWTLQCIANLRKFVVKTSTEILHVHRSTDHWAAALALATLRERPVLIRSRHIVTPIKSDLATHWLFGRATDRVIAVAAVIEHEVRKAGVIANEKLSVIPGSIEIDRFSVPSTGMLRNEVGAAPGDKLIGIVARLSKIKGHTHFLEAAEIIAESRNDVRFVVIGDGPLRAELEAEAASRGISSRVHFLGWRKDVELLLPDLTLYVLTSVGSEGSSRATLEAMAAGLPVVATSVGVLPEVVEDGVTGRILPPADPVRMANAILAVLDSPNLASMGQRSRERVTRLFSIDEMARRTEAVYADALAERRKGEVG